MAQIKEDLHISGMTCQHCVSAVEGALQALDGVHVEEVGIGRARVRYEAGAVRPAALEAAVADAGYTLDDAERVA